MKYLGANLTNYMQDLYMENYKTLREINVDLNSVSYHEKEDSILS
jgi:hypothetical protein